MKKKIAIVLLTLALIAFVTFSYLLIRYTCEHNSEYINNFKKRTVQYDYEEAISQDPVDLDLLLNYVKGNYIGDPAEIEKIIMDIPSPIDISYYQSPQDSSPAYLIKKGAVIHVDYFGDIPAGFSFRGGESIPTGDANYRLSKPFRVEGETLVDNLLYIKTTDLLKVISAYLDSNPDIKNARIQETGSNHFYPNDGNAAILQMTIADSRLYFYGIFLSDNLLLPTFLPITKVCIFISVLLLITLLLVAVRRTPEKKTA